jgi:hypothetical protein
MEGAILITWGPLIPGREELAWTVMGNAWEYFKRLHKEGRITGFRVWGGITGTLGAMALIEGEMDQLFKVHVEDETLKFLGAAEAVVRDFEVKMYAGGSEDFLLKSYELSMDALGALGLTGQQALTGAEQPMQALRAANEAETVGGR